jgi:hypothetical protein
VSHNYENCILNPESPNFDSTKYANRNSKGGGSKNDSSGRGSKRSDHGRGGRSGGRGGRGTNSSSVISGTSYCNHCANSNDNYYRHKTHTTDACTANKPKENSKDKFKIIEKQIAKISAAILGASDGKNEDD